jgi:Leucine-rich repeat (LRR) protein
LKVLEPNRASLAWDVEEAERIAQVAHNPHYYPSYQGLRIDVDTHLAPEVANYNATTLHIEGQLENRNFADMSALARLELKVLEVNRGYFDMTDLPSLTRLDVSNAVLKRSMRLPKSLTQLLLRNVDSVSTVLNDIKSLGMLEVLELQSMKLKGRFPNELLGLELFILHLQGNNLDGRIPPHLGVMHASIQDLDLSGNFFSGNIPTELGNASKLASLNLSNNQLRGCIPTELGLLRLETLVLSRNQLHGTIPQVVFQEKLCRLDLSCNQLCGRIPTEINVLRGLYVDLSHNLLTGNIPSEVFNMTFDPDLEVSLWFSHNNLQGSIPPNLMRREVEVLDLSHNKLTGVIPTTIGLMTNVQTLHLNNNRLSGTIPNEMRLLPKDAKIKLHTNLLQGRMPRR